MKIQSNIIRKFPVRDMILTAFILISALHVQAYQKKGQRPNVILIIADDHRYDWMHHKGKNYMETPHLDRLAEEGWSFPNAFCCAGVCSPARSSILTGKYMHQASAPDIVWQNNSFLYLQKTFPQILHEQGYRTGYIGKFHLGEEEKSHPDFDLWASFPFVGKYYDQSIWINGEKVEKKGFTDDYIASMSDSTIKAWASSEQPFCLIIGLKATHIPFTYPNRMKDKYSDVIFEKPETFDLNYSESKPGLANNLIDAKTWPGAIPKYGSFQEWVRSYTRLASTIDESVGKIMDAVEQNGIKNNTILIYTSDQGYSLGEFSMCEKHYAYEQIMRVPLIVRFPDQKDPSEPPTDMVMNMDIAPTVLDYCIGKTPKDMVGKSWSYLQKKNSNAKRKPLREEFFFDFWHNEQDILPPMQAVRTSNYKLIKYEYQPFEELYDLKNDSLEQNNLIDSSQYQFVKEKLERKLEKWKKKTGWSSRSSRSLKTIYVSGKRPFVEERQKQNTYCNPSISEVISFNDKWEKLTDEGQGFDIDSELLGESSDSVIYVAIPLKNRNNFDPFISLRISFSESTQTEQPAFSGWFDGKEIYTNVAYKRKRGIPMIEESEEPLRRGFDLGYNPPLRNGENVIILRILGGQSLPESWHFKVVGALSDLKWY